MNRKLCIAITSVFGAFLLAYELFLNKSFEIEDTVIKELVDMTVTRMLGGVIFFTLTLYLGYKVLNPVKKPFLRALIFSLPAFAVVVNNLPIIPLIVGSAYVTGEAWEIALLAAECFAIGLFEEMAFRGVVLLGIMEKRRACVRDLIISILLSSAVFGAVHLVNLITSSPAAVILQIGYSFLIGAMCSVVLIKTANIWLCVILHALFDFCGSLVPKLGEGIIWDVPTVIITVVIAVFTTVYMFVSLIKTDASVTDRIYGTENTEKEKKDE